MIETPKFGRRYLLKVETHPRAAGGKFEDANMATVELPITCDFSVTRNVMASANVANFRLLNLAEATRNQIFRDTFALEDMRAVQFWAGYGKNLSMVFNGQVQRAHSYRESGATEMVTEIEAFEGYAMVNGFSSRTESGGQTYASLISKLSKDLPFIDGVKLGTVPGESRRGTALHGNTWKLINQYVKGQVFIDNNQLIALAENEGIRGDILKVSAETGLLGSPQRAEHIIEFEMLFTPQLKCGQLVSLTSKVNGIYDRLYKVMGFHHTGTISPAISGTARTRVQLYLGTQSLITV